MSYLKCNVNFETQFAFINGQTEPIHISEYIKTNCKDTPKCNNGHELCCANGSIIKAYFRHKHNEDVDTTHPMTRWHCEWQGNFLNTEVEFKKINDKQYLPHEIPYIKPYELDTDAWANIIDAEIERNKAAYHINKVAMTDQITCGKCKKKNKRHQLSIIDKLILILIYQLHFMLGSTGF